MAVKLWCIWCQSEVLQPCNHVSPHLETRYFELWQKKLEAIERGHEIQLRKRMEKAS